MDPTNIFLSNLESQCSAIFCLIAASLELEISQRGFGRGQGNCGHCGVTLKQKTNVNNSGKRAFYLQGNK